MTKPVIVTRETKGTPLTRAELDGNFTNINNATIGVAGDAGTPISASLNDTITINGGNGIGTAVVAGNLVVNLNGVYGGDSSTSTTVGDNTSVLLATVATSGSYADLTNKPTIPTIPSQTGNSGKFLTTDGTSTSWGTAGSSGNNIAYISSSDGGSVTFAQLQTNYTTSTWVLETAGGTGITVTSNRFNLPIGTYIIEWVPGFLYGTGGTPATIRLWDYDGGSRVANTTMDYVSTTISGTTKQAYFPGIFKVVVASATNYAWSQNTPGGNNGASFDIGSAAASGKVAMKITKIA